MGNAIASLVAFLLVFGMSAFAAAWVTVLPTIGILWVIGWLP